ncbi:MAG: class I SAM-dependent methyltransferase [Steroidobacteraceae bacterium]
MQRITSWFKRKLLRDRQALWNHQYASGRWDCLHAPVEDPRFDATVTLLRRHAPAADVLEVGCGEALLQRRLSRQDYRSWFGIDVSDLAIASARLHAGPGVEYHTADMDSFEPPRSFDVLVFAESLYYSRDCTALLRRYLPHLRSGGILIASMFDGRRSAQTWSCLHQLAQPIDCLATRNEAGIWRCEALRAV